jgi:imidazolonepropionase-like amidohydrolase
MRPMIVIALLLVQAPAFGRPQDGSFSSTTRAFISVDTPIVALTGVRVIDGTGASPRENQAVVISDGVIQAIGDVDRVEIPSGARVIDLSGRTVLPGFVMLHEHMFYSAGGGHFNQQGFSFPRLYLAGGATTVRTAGSIMPYADLNLKRAIDAGQTPGPKMDVTGPYLNGPGLPILAVKALDGVEDAREMVTYWAGEGATSFKAYMHISRAELKAAIDEAHGRGLKLTGHLCSITFREAADLGIDNLEHGFFASTDFVPGKEEDRCPPSQQSTTSLLELDVDGPEARDLIQYLVERDVAITSTLAVFETFTPGRPPAPNGALDAMALTVRDQYLRRRASIAVQDDSPYSSLFEKEMALELAFARAGGLLVVGTDPTGYGGIVAGFANHRAVELLVEAGFSPVEAISIATLNGARYLERADHIGTIATGKTADLIVVRGDPATRIADIRNVEIVFKDGIGYDPEKLIASATGIVGLR